MGRLEWDKTQWPDHRKMLSDFKQQGVNVVTISQPYVLTNGRAIDNYRLLDPQGIFCKTDGTDTTHTVTIWVGQGGMFDVSNPATRQWLRGRYKQLTDEGVMNLERLVELMCHNPARLFEVHDRGFIRPGFKADLVLVRPHSPWTVTPDIIQSKCGWSPMEGHEYQWRVEQTFCNGHLIYNNGVFDDDSRGEELRFR